VKYPLFLMEWGRASDAIGRGDLREAARHAREKIDPLEKEIERLLEEDRGLEESVFREAQRRKFFSIPTLRIFPFLSTLISGADTVWEKYDTLILITRAQGIFLEGVEKMSAYLWREDTASLGDFQAAMKEASLNWSQIRSEAPELEEQIKAIQEKQDEFIRKVSGVMELLRAGKRAQLVRYEETVVDPLDGELNRLSGMINGEYLDKIRKAEGRMEAVTQTIVPFAHRLFLISGLLLSFSLGVVFLIGRRVIRPIREMEAATRKIASGDLSIKISQGRSDELGLLASSFNTMVDRLRETLSREEEARGQIIRQILHLSTLQEMVMTLVSDLDLSTTLQRVMEKGRLLTGAEGACIVLYDSVKGEFGENYAQGLSDRCVQSMSIAKGGVAERSLSQNRIIRASDQPDADQPIDPLYREEGILSVLVIPMMIGKKPLGVLHFFNKKGLSFSRETIDQATSLSRFAAAAIHNALVNSSLAEANDQSVKMADELKRKNGELEAFVYTVSHDLKTPLVSLHGLTGMLLKKYADRLDEEGRHYLTRLVANTRQLESLISDLLELSRVGRVTRPPEEVDIDHLLSLLIDSCQEEIKKRGVRVILHAPFPKGQGDRVFLQQIFQNLFTNALKFLDASGEPRIEIGWKEENDSYQFFVKDNGIGIDPKYHEKIFGIFQRLQEIEAEGTGVGLTIIKKIIDQVGEKLDVSSRKGEGAAFTFTWRKAPVAQGSPV
jgi:signal transduction histidine kinase